MYLEVKYEEIETYNIFNKRKLYFYNCVLLVKNIAVDI